GSLERYPLHIRFENALVSYVEYIRMTLWPVGLAVFYPHPFGEIRISRVAFAFMVLAGISIATLLRYQRAPYLAVGWFWFLGMLVPVIGVVQVGQQALADRYTYLPSIGLSVIAVWGGLDLAGRWELPKQLALVAGVCILALAITTWINVGYWRDAHS